MFRVGFTFKHILLGGAFIALPLFIILFWYTSSGDTITSFTETYQGAGKEVRADFQSLPTLPITQTDDTYQIEDTLSDGISIQYANSTLPTLTEGADSIGGSASKPKLNLSFPKDYSQPIALKLDEQRSIEITDLSGKNDYTVDTLSQETQDQALGSLASKLGKESLWQQIKNFGGLASKKEEATQNYLRYTSKDGRKELLYAYQKDQATGEKKLKHWTLYQEGNGVEQEEYQFENAKVKVNEAGVAEVFYFGESDLKNEQVKAEVDSNLLERAQRTLAKEMGEDLLSGNRAPDFTIPKPYYLDREGNKHEAEWKWHEETKSLSVNFTPESYPVALDPTLQFSVPGMSNTGSVITGETSGDYFGSSLTTGDLDADGRTDLVVGAVGYPGGDTNGRVYIFYADSSIATTAVTADVTITGETTYDYFGDTLVTGDFNADGRTDLAVGANGYPDDGGIGRVYIFYNDGSIPTTAATADVIITGETSSNFGASLTSGDFNVDGKIDLAVGASVYSTQTGRVYIFYGDGSIPTTAGTADVIITGNATNDFFGTSLTSGDYNADGRTDLAVGAYFYSAATGRAYIFYNDGSIPTTAATADVTITGNASGDSFSDSLTSGDFNADGRTDLVVGAQGYSVSTGRAYIFYNDGSIPTTAATADVIITGETSSTFGASLTSGDFNGDGRTDLAVGATYYSSWTGRVYIFYNDGSIPTTAATADVIISGETTSNNFGEALTAGDMNGDGRTDLAVGARGYSSDIGRVYIFYSQNGQVNTNQSITGGTTGDDFGYTLTAGDWNADGRTDLAVGATGYPGGDSNGRVYIFYNDGSIPTTAGTADVTITGETTFDYFGDTLATGDFNADGRTDLAVGATGYPNDDGTGRAYIFYNDGSIPTTAGTADVIITGETTTNLFGISLLPGDFNSDGETDLAVGASAYSGDSGRTYIFYNDGSIPTTAGTADVIITGEGASYFGAYMTADDFNADGRTDLAVGAPSYSANTGRAYIFYNDGSIPTTAATADVTITGNATSDSFGRALITGDFDASGTTDLAVGAPGYSSSTGRVYLFYSDSSIPTTAATADVTITGNATSDQFGYALVAGDLTSTNSYKRDDLVVGAYGYSSQTGRAYVFYNDGSIPTTAGTADVTITGAATNNRFGYEVVMGDLNSDGATDLVVGTESFNGYTDKVYIFNNDGSIPTTAATADTTLTGVSQTNFGPSLVTGDFNADGRIDLAVGATYQGGSTYIFYNDGSMPTTAGTADVTITGVAASNAFGVSLVAGDYNADGRTDLVVGASSFGSGTGRLYVFYNDGSFPATATSADVIIAGETNSLFGVSLVPGDFNADGKTDLAVGGDYYSANYTGRVYVFYNDGSYPTTAGSADVIITGESTLTQFGSGLTTGDLNADGKTDLVVGAWYLGKVYIFYGGSIVTENASGADVIIVGTRYFGWSLVAGDFNADGRTDLAVSDTEAAGSAAGKVRLFYNDGSIPTTTGTADVTITEASSSQLFGSSLAAGDFNTDGRTDLVVSAYGYSSYTGRAFVFYNDGSYPAAPSSADVILTGGEATNSYFGASLVSGDFNADGRIDLAVGASVYSSTTGRVYMYTLGNDPVITGGATGDSFGYALSSGDFNADGKTDLAVGASYYAAATGRVYIFYNDGSIPTTANGADVVIDGENNGGSYEGSFGASLAAGDWNSDGRTDLAVGAYDFNVRRGKVYLFYNDGSYSVLAANADIIATGESSSAHFGRSLAAGDFNADGRTDLAIGSERYSSYTGYAYIFYNDGASFGTVGCTTGCLAANADIIISGVANARFGYAMTVGDWNSDGRTDLAVGAYAYSTDTGRVYLFYNDGSIPTTAATADVTITGGAISDGFGTSLASGDWNSDGRTDLAVGAQGYSSNTGRAYLFYNDGSIPTTAGTADVTITGETTNNDFGRALTSGDFNTDGRTDLAVGASGYSTGTGRAYLFYNDGSIPTTAGTADVIITGEAINDWFGYSLTSGDWNSDGRTDLAIGARGYSSTTGRVYIFYSQNGQVNTNQSITGEATQNYFGYSMTAGDFNADGRIDLAVGAISHSAGNGRAYIFYNDGSIPTGAGSADIFINGEAGSSFGYSMVAGDFNADGKIDLAVGANEYSSYTGRAYIFYNGSIITENASGADVIITGEASSAFGESMTAGDFNADGRTDFVVGGRYYASFGGTGRAYIFYNDGSIPTTAGTADVTITGEATSNYFGYSLTSGDYNADGRTDLAVGAFGYSSQTGRVYIFYNDGSIPTTAGTADVTITGNATNDSFGSSLTSGDFNADGRTDLAVGAYGYSSGTGRAYIFYNDGSIPTTAGTADVIITGETNSDLGESMTAGDWNADGRTDLAVSATSLVEVGHVYLFYNDGSYPSTANTADVTIAGESDRYYFGKSLVANDWNADGRTDLVVGSREEPATQFGRVYLYETRENFAWQIQRQPQPGSGPLRVGTNTTGQELKITGEAGSGFGASLTKGDLNNDGKADLIVGATTYATNTGRVYVFYSDGTLATGATNADVVITGEGANGYFGGSITGDFNADGRTDLVVGASSFGSGTGRLYVFYNDGSFPTTATSADVSIAGETNSSFGLSLAAGDFNADGKTDLAVGGDYYSANYTGRVYVFYNDGSYPTSAGSADVIITGESTLTQFGSGLTTGDLNADGKTDLVVGAWYLGKVYIFYGGSIVTENASGADVIIVGTRYFGWSLVAGDFNADGRTDLAVSDTEASGSAAGKVRLFYNDGSIPTTTGTADVTITEASSSQLFGSSLLAGDFNADGRTDLVVSAYGYSANTGRAFVFYNDGSYPAAPSSADVILTGGEATSSYFGASLVSGDFNADGRTDLAVGASVYSSSTGRVYVYTLGNDPVITGETTDNFFGISLTTGDFNADGKTDLAVGAYGYSTYTGRVYIFHNDGSIPATAGTADVTITGGATINFFGASLTTGDFNADGKTDLAVGARGYSSNTGRAYLFYNDGSIPTTAATADITITGGATANYFGVTLATGDFNADGRTDLAVGAQGYSSFTGRAYLFYNDGSIPTTAGTADVTITGGATDDSFGYALASGDFNADGRIDLAVGAYGYSSSTGQAYIFYNDGSIPTTAGTADVTITGEATSDYFGDSLTSGDWNADGRVDLAVGAFGYSTSTGRAYLFYNDGSIPTTAATADVTITGGATNNQLGISLVTGDWNADGRTDLAVGADGYSTSTGRVYVFYNDGSIPTTAGTADVTITGGATNDYFGSSLTSGDWNADGRVDLAVGAYGYSSATATGRVYVYTSEAAPTGSLPAVTSLKGTGKFKGTGKLR